MKLNVLRLVIVSLACATAFVVITRVRAQKSSVTQNLAVSPASLGIAALKQTPATSPISKEKTFGEVGKNVKVLNDLPASQEGTVMNFFAASMGRRCDFCHAVVDGKLVFESDTKPEKETARSMIKMVLAINKDNFKGNTQVSCYTCHRGRNQPQSIPALPLPTPMPRPQPAASPAAGQPAPSPTPRPTGPTADQIAAKYVDAIGGTAAIDKIKTVVLKGTFAGVSGPELSHEVDLASPDSPEGTYGCRLGAGL